LDEIGDRARAIARAGSINEAIKAGTVPAICEVSGSEGVVLGLLQQGVKKYIGILGHGNTTFGGILKIYQDAGLVRFYQFRNEIGMAHAATALSWIYGEVPAVVTSIGPGALQAFAGSLAAASNGIGVYHIYGDETTHGEGYNMQQIPNRGQGRFGRMTEAMSGSFTLHTPEALREAMRRGVETVFCPYFKGPFFLCLPINIQGKIATLRLDTLPERPSLLPLKAEDDAFAEAASLILNTGRVVIKAGGGSRHFSDEVRSLAEAAGAPVVFSPGSVGVLPDAHPLNMHVGGSKGSISGNGAMEDAELLIVIGSRAVCQADCSGTGYPNARAVININGRLSDLAHYGHTVMLQGDIGAVVRGLVSGLRNRRRHGKAEASNRLWLHECLERKKAWSALKKERCREVLLHDEVWGQPVLTQPSAVSLVSRFAKSRGAIKLFDAGDVQANGFQVVEDDTPFESITETGASYMGFAVSALMASAIADRGRPTVAFTGDGSFMMNPQILVDAVVHGARGIIVVFDNRRMGAISSLQVSQKLADFGTSDTVEIDFAAMANAVKGVRGFFGGTSAASLEQALAAAANHDGLSLVHVPVYWGHDELGGMGSYGRWNVGPWVPNVERLYARQGI
jgi:3D-(3,5/4)-trihydroxycyclohexane-1,2-dione acylhydrolase (decyclizing)